MTNGQFLVLYLFCAWAALMGAHGYQQKHNALYWVPSREWQIGPQRSACGDRWQFCDEWRQDGPGGQKIERRVI